MNGDQNFEARVRTFEDNAQICCWDESEKLMYCQRLLTGAAKLCNESSKGIL